MPSKKQLAMESIHIEQNMIKETVGSQDQVCAAYGGLNLINFSTSGEIDVQPVTLSRARLEELDSHLMLFYTGIQRTASDVAKNYVEDIDGKKNILKKMQKIVQNGLEILNSNYPIYRFGELLHETWMLKKSLGEDVSNGYVDALYERARKAGAIGGKIAGAGGGGFLLLFVPPSKQRWIRESLSDKIHVPFRFESGGSQIIFYEPERVDYSEMEKDRAKRTISSFKELDSMKKLTEILAVPLVKEPDRNVEQKV
jgi:D-glycero-alpha-D-manno-heptose-7-phosphate kinase